MATKTTQSHYTEVEAAEELGITVTQFRDLIRHHVIDQEDALRNVPQTSFQASDLLILRLLTGKSVSPER